VSTQSEIQRLNAAKVDLAAAIESRGISVPDGVTIDVYANLVRQIMGPEMYLDKLTYDPNGVGKNIYAEILKNPPTYTAMYTLDGWTDATPEQKANGFNFQQTVALQKDQNDFPDVTPASRFLPMAGVHKTGLYETDKVLQNSLNTVVDGVSSVSGTGQITTLVVEKPASDVPVTFSILP